jgi:hypothetical protein
METNQMTNLSHSAQAVLNVVLNEAAHLSEQQQARVDAAAVLRAAADQVSPENYESFSGHLEYDQGLEARNDSVREALLALADELEGR